MVSGVQLEFHPSTTDRHSLVEVRGELDMASAPVLLARTVEVVDDGCPRITLDLAGLRFCDSSGLRALIVLAHRADAAGGGLVLASVPEVLHRRIEGTGLSGTLPTTETRGIPRTG